MSDKVVGLDGKEFEVASDYDLAVVDLLERALADVKANKSHSVLIATVIPKEGDGDSYDIECYWHGRKLTLLAGASRIAHRINLSCDETVLIIT